MPSFKILDVFYPPILNTSSHGEIWGWHTPALEKGTKHLSEGIGA